MSREQELKPAVTRWASVDLRLYYPNGDQRSFWEDIQSSGAYEEDIAQIRREGERLLAEPIPQLTYDLFARFARQGTRLEYEKVYFERRRRLNTCALLTLLEPGKEEYLLALQEMIWTICDEYTWCLPAHLNGESSANIRSTIDLFSAETGFTLSEIRLLLQDRLAPLLISRMEDEVARRLFTPFLSHEFGWETATHNWSAVCAGSIGSAALLMMEDTGELEEILLKTERCMAYYLQGFGADGACLEGLGYWNYGFGYFVYYADLLLKRSQGAMDWFRDEKVSRIALFQQRSFLGGRAVVNFSDSQPESAVHIGLSHYLAGLYEDFETPPPSLRSAYGDDHCSRWAPALRNLIWRDPGKPGSEWGEASYYLPDARWLISRVSDGEELYAFAAKGGRNDEPHNHNDLGHFILYGAGEVWCSDLGCGEYTADYFGDGRYDYDCNGSQGHSVPIIDGHVQCEGADSEAIVLEAATGEEKEMLTVELTSAYRAPVLREFVRSLEWNKQEERPVLTLRDRFNFHSPPGSLVERIVTRVQPELKQLNECWMVVLRAAGADEQGEIREQEQVQRKEEAAEGLAADERTWKRTAVQDSECTREPDLSMDDRPSLAIHYDPELMEPELKAYTFRDHDGKDATWYAIDFNVKDPGLCVNIGLGFQFI
ncbi:hypothetical protein PVOR_07120 [Paenibacillus vortex V453]|uniref:Heparinase II/III family protein n=1 Tax=Paenibacillus vortex V453 TaxID=715225 RepID=A0A2R9SZ54_9BACL|nr:heparinase II/III family protein [Paenibacillus vortex]EFU42607.1 hypothetical protein PVOR_07120 [Paenibacillus vortex V453]